MSPLRRHRLNRLGANGLLRGRARASTVRRSSLLEWLEGRTLLSASGKGHVDAAIVAQGNDQGGSQGNPHAQQGDQDVALVAQSDGGQGKTKGNPAPAGGQQDQGASSVAQAGGGQGKAQDEQGGAAVVPPDNGNGKSQDNQGDQKASQSRDSGAPVVVQSGGAQDKQNGKQDDQGGDSGKGNQGNQGNGGQGGTAVVHGKSEDAPVAVATAVAGGSGAQGGSGATPVAVPTAVAGGPQGGASVAQQQQGDPGNVAAARPGGAVAGAIAQVVNSVIAAARPLGDAVAQGGARALVASLLDAAGAFGTKAAAATTAVAGQVAARASSLIAALPGGSVAGGESQQAGGDGSGLGGGAGTVAVAVPATAGAVAQAGVEATSIDALPAGGGAAQGGNAAGSGRSGESSSSGAASESANEGAGSVAVRAANVVDGTSRGASARAAVAATATATAAGSLPITAIFLGQGDSPSIALVPAARGLAASFGEFLGRMRPNQMVDAVEFGGPRVMGWAAAAVGVGEAPEVVTEADPSVTPRGSERLAESPPLDLAQLDHALQRYLQEADELGGALVDWLAADGLRPWLFGVAAAALACAAARRWTRNKEEPALACVEGLDFPWSPGVVPDEA